MNTSVAEEKPKGIAIRVLAKFATLFWWLLLTVLVLAALYTGVGRQITQNIDDYRPQIEQQLSERLGHSILIGSLSTRWNWLNPTIIARDLAVKPEPGSEDVIGSLQSLRVGLDVLASLRRLRIVFSTFDANGLELVVNQSPRGELEIEGADLPEPVANDLSQWIDLAGQWLSDPSIRITRVRLGLRDGSGQLRQVEIPQLDLVYRRGFFHASGRAMRPGTTQQLASFRLVGQHFFRGDFTGQFYGNINSGRLFDGLIQEYGWKGVRAEGFDIGGQVWLSFRDGQMVQASGSLQTPYLQLGVGNESLAPLEDIQARFGWRRKSATIASNQLPWHETGEFHLNDLTWRWNGQTVPGFSLRFQAGSQTETLIVDKFPIAPVRGLLSRLQILPAQLTSALDNYSPAGTLDHLLLKIPRDNSGHFRLTANLRDISVKAVGGAPSVQGLDGLLVVDQNGGLVQADSDTLTWGFPVFFSGLWDVRNFRADVAWQVSDGPVRVYASDIAMDFGPESKLTGAFDLKLSSGGEDVLGLRVGVEDGNAGMLSEFVPVHLVGQELYAWLTTAVEEANIVQGTYFGHGQIGGDAPPGSFISSMFYDFDSATVQYDERWPEVTSAAGRVFVHQGRTRVDLASGKTGEIELRPGQVRVVPGGEDQGGEDQSGEDQSIMVYIDAGGPVSPDALAYWMENSPLEEMASGASDNLQVEGRFYLDLGVGFALNSDQSPDVDVTLRAEAGSLTFSRADLHWSDLSGELSYSTSTGFSSAPVTARFLGNPVSVWVQRSRFGDGLTLRQQGKVDVAALQNRLGLPEDLSSGAEGTLGYEAILELPTDKTASVRLISDLKGVAVNLPQPLGKEAEAAALLDITLQPTGGESVELVVDWQDRTNLLIDLQSERVEVTVNELQLGDRQLKGILVEALASPENWLINISADWIKGTMTWPVSRPVSETNAENSSEGSASRPVIVELEKLSLARNQGEQPDTDPSVGVGDSVKAFRDLDFASWPDVDVQIADLRINEEAAGNWSFNLTPGVNQLEVENIEGKLKSMTLTGTLAWRLRNNEEMTGFKGALNGKSLADIGPLVAAEIPFKNDKTVIDLDLDWPGRPDQFTVDNLSGSARMRFDEGVILESNSTAQLFRIFNLLNSDTLLRRLKLDFSDLYEAGVAFDAISGKVRLDNGVLALDPELQIVGPSGAFKFSGTTSLTKETLDMNMVVVLPLTQNLPLAALLLGAGAPIGGALFVLDKVLGDPLSKLASASYSVTGSWDEPNVRLKRVFGDGN